MSKITFHYRWKWPLQSNVEQLWPYISDTDRFRAATGFPTVVYTEETDQGGVKHRIGHFRIYGVPIEWEEDPFEWIRHRDVINRQHFRKGPVSSLKAHIQLEPRSDGGTDLTYECWVTPGNLLGYPGVPIQVGLLYRWRFRRAFQQVDKFVQAQAQQPFITRHTPVSSIGRTRLRDLSNGLIEAGHNPTIVGNLIDHIRTAPDNELTRMRPYAFADKWRTDRYATLELFLQATKLGLLDLSWDMLCPECRGAKHKSHHLHEVSHDGYCPSCGIQYEVDFARSVEATFQVNPAIKAVVREEFCEGSPQNTPHILLQQVLAPGESRAIKLLLEPRRYRWRIPKLGARNTAPRTVNTPDDVSNGRIVVDVNTRTRTTWSTLTVTDDDLQIDAKEIGAGVVTFTLVNESKLPQIMIFEHTDWSDQASTAAEVTSLQSFRDLFSSEALRPGESISVERMALLFTDLKGSTAMYQTVGDAYAFRRVMDHFSILRDGVARNHGSLVKTIGDAIMAVFSDPVHAIAASTEILQSMETYNENNPETPLILKMGIHQGTCIAVTLNERLDYFGSVVNLAARLEGQSQGHDVVISQAMMTDPAVMDYLKHHDVNVKSFDANLKGFADSFTLHRLTVDTVSGQDTRPVARNVAAV